MAFITTLLVFTTQLPTTLGLGFSHADTQLTERDTEGFPAIRFGNAVNRILPRASPSLRCKAFPGDQDWPSDNQWQRFNASLNGALLKPSPPGAVCYPDNALFNPAACAFLVNNSSGTNFQFENPIAVGNVWPQGHTCPILVNPKGSCTQGGYPSYVVNATSVKHVQLAVNFARNNNIRLVIKNTGHDFLGRNLGAGSLSVWTHYFKGFEFLPSYNQVGGSYRGAAARVGSGLQIWEAWSHAADHNVALLAGSCLTVGAYGGYLTGGGHSPLSSKYGLGVDQALSLDVVTADGRAVTADAKTNSDLFFALRGGGGSTYGIVTSAIVKAHPALNLTIAAFTFTVGNTNSAPGPNPTISNITAFWQGFDAVFRFGLPTVDAGGYLWTNGIRVTNTSFLMQVRVQLPGFTIAEAATFVQPLIKELNNLGIPIIPSNPTTSLYSGKFTSGGGGGTPRSSRFGSRLFPRTTWEDSKLFRAAMDAARLAVEAGYTFHGLNMAPTEKAGGFPAPAGVNSVWRKSIMHADVFDPNDYTGVSVVEAETLYQRLQSFMDPLRAATPGGGAYYNEADIQEPDWQNSFFGSNYLKLLKIKRERDPLQVFWAPRTPGSEGWAVQAPPELPLQNGRLCRV